MKTSNSFVRIVSLVLVLAMVTGLCACGKAHVSQQGIQAVGKDAISAEVKPTDKENTESAEAKPADKEDSPAAETKPADKVDSPAAETKPADKVDSPAAEAKPADKEDSPAAETKPADKVDSPAAEVKPADKEETSSLETSKGQDSSSNNVVLDLDFEVLEDLELETLEGVTQESFEQMDEEALGDLVDDLIEELEQREDITLPETQEEPELPAIELDDTAYNEDGAMEKPFDQIYPEVIEQEQVTFDDETLLIKLDNATGLTAGLRAAGVAALEQIVPMEKQSWYEAKLVEGTDAMKALESVRQLSEVLLAEYNYTIQTAAIDGYKEFGDKHKEGFDKNHHHKDQWHMHHCGIPDAYETLKNPGGNAGVVVAVIDTGVDYTHQDLSGNIWKNDKEIPDNHIDDDGNGYVDDYYGVDVIANTGDPSDTNGHGTHVAGIIAAQNNNLGVVGIAYNVQIMAIKAANHSGYLQQSDIAKAINYAYEMGADVINMSFGGTACSIAVQDALAVAYSRCVLVASAGNSGKPNEATDHFLALPNYPAALNYVLGVMSVDENGVESSFTNWDVQAFNGQEYELYAPGEQIMSTLPGNRYGMLSGTSMAAPMVSAIAAILRSEFSDREQYPTKFIYGQLASTSSYTATCLDPDGHAVLGGTHNLPQIVNLHDALTKLPKPEVGVQDYALFDDPALSAKNNGDGVIDAGETIALGFTLSNRWGASENTWVTIDTLSQIGEADPYVTIHEASLNYGSIATYSTGDCGKVMENGMHVGWNSPFLLTVSEDCPNDYTFTVNITIHCENGMDENDGETYTFDDYNMLLAVRNGVILPAIITEDMVLTSDNLYIIPRATVIEKDVTVRVMPGTRIQFWSADPEDTYAQSGIAYLMVNGNFFVEGTKDEPVQIFPSELMDQYNVEIAEGKESGFVSLCYADITNFAVPWTNNSVWGNVGTYNQISYADHCTFRFNYGTGIRYRCLSGGVVKDELKINQVTVAKFGTVKNSVFYKLGLPNGYLIELYGNAQRCVFADCGIQYGSSDSKFTAENCLFLGNNFEDTANPGKFSTSSLTLQNQTTFPVKNCYAVKYCEATGTTYVITNSYALKDATLKALGGSQLVIETEAELQQLKQLFADSDYILDLGITYSVEQGCYVWSDGTRVADFLDPNRVMEEKGLSHTLYMQLKNGGIFSLWKDSSAKRYMYEFPGQILPGEITFAQYAVSLDLESTYQLSPLSAPSQLPAAGFAYESKDETVVTVSESGLVTPVGVGNADVYVYSLDGAVSNYVTFTVEDKVALESMTFNEETAEVALGESLSLELLLTPANSTRQITYTSSDEAIVKVSATGVVTGIASGTATVTAECDGITAQIQITAYVKATSLALGSIGFTANLADGTVELPAVHASQGAELNLSWRSTDETVATIEDGKVTLLKEGTTSLLATDARSGLSAVCLLIVQDGEFSQIKDIAADSITNGYYGALLENGDLYYWSHSNAAPQLILQDAVAADVTAYGHLLAAKEDGTLILYSCGTDATEYKVYDQLLGKKIAGVQIAYNYNCYAWTEDGYAYSWGTENDRGQLSLGHTNAVTDPTLINLDNVKQIAKENNSAWFLQKNGDLYYSGSVDNGTNTLPTLKAQGVARVAGTTTTDAHVIYTNDTYAHVHRSDGPGNFFAIEGFAAENVWFATDTNGIGIRGGHVYLLTCSGGSLKMAVIPGIVNAEHVWMAKTGTYYIKTQEGLLYAYGSNSKKAMAGATTATEVTEPILMPITPLPAETLNLTGSNLADENTLQEAELALTFNKALTGAVPLLYADGQQIPVQHRISNANGLALWITDGFKEGVSYEVVLDAGSVSGAAAVTNTEEIRVSFTATTVEEEEETEPPVIHESQLDETVERIWTIDSFVAAVNAVSVTENDTFRGNVVLNRTSTDTDVTHWLRVQAPSVSTKTDIPLGGNYWGTDNTDMVEMQILDYLDIPTTARLESTPFLTEAPENTFPFVAGVKLFDKSGAEVTTVGAEEITFRIAFNRDMDTTLPLEVLFGSAYPYGDHIVTGAWVDARTWQGSFNIGSTMENGNQFITVRNGLSATENLALQPDLARFSFAVDTTAAQALIMQGSATETGINLSWTQDDFDTLMGYNVYRSDAEDGLYIRLNAATIPADEKTFFDTNVEPGVMYYYNFTVVKTDLTESEPSGKIVIRSMDTMAPNIYHSGVANATEGKNLVITATVTDNLSISYAELHYRISGTEQWKTIRMNSLNDKYSAIIPPSDVTSAGLEYYLVAFDGISYTYKGTAEDPFCVLVQQSVAAGDLGDVNMDGKINVLDALMVLYTINDKYNMTTEEFSRADLDGNGILEAHEALRILQYANGSVGSVDLRK